MNLLIVEDDQLLRNYLRLQAAETAWRDGADLFEAATLDDALAIVRCERIDAVLSDGPFPPGWGEGMNDLSRWAECWRTLHRECKRLGVPFVLLSGDPAIVETARSLDVSAFSKPCGTRVAIEQVLVLAAAHLAATARLNPEEF